MTNDETRPLPADGPAPARPEGARIEAVNGTQPEAVPPATPSPWATTRPVAPSPWATQPVVPVAPSPYGPTPSASPGPAQPAPPRATPTWPEVEPDPWVDVTPSQPAEAAGLVGAPRPRRGGKAPRVLGVIGLVAAGAVAGALIVNTIDGSGGSDTAAVQPGAASQNGAGAGGAGAPGGVPGQGLQGGPGQGLQGGAGQGLQGGPGQGQGGERRLIGTLTAVSGSKVTVKTSSGSGTYDLVAQTQIVRNGAPAAASDLKAGDRVLLHVFPATGSDGVLERLIAVSGASGSGSGTSGSGTTGSDTDATT
jgi:hypothetical protein